MKGKIRKDGSLVIYRGDKSGLYQQQWCPFSTFTTVTIPTSCGQWCPHFGEPIALKKFSYEPRNWFEKIFGVGHFGYMVESERRRIEICHEKALIFDKLEVANEN